MAAKAVIAEQRGKPRATYVSAANPDRSGVTPATARQFLISYLSALSARLATQITPRSLTTVVKPPRVAPRPLTHRRTTEPANSTAPTAEVEPLANPVLIFTDNAGAAQLITDAEYHTSLHSHVTQTWRASIEHNNRVAEERARKRSLWVG
jgi:hypothetical protein